MEKCPNCRALFQADPECYRCGFDYSHSLKCEDQGIFEFHQATTFLKKGALNRALSHASNACLLHNRKEYRRLKMIILLKNLYDV